MSHQNFHGSVGPSMVHSQEYPYQGAQGFQNQHSPQGYPPTQQMPSQPQMVPPQQQQYPQPGTVVPMNQGQPGPQGHPQMPPPVSYPQPYQPQYPPNYGQTSLISRVPNTFTFNIDYFSKELQVHYQGAFTVQRPKMKQQMLIEARTTEILGGYHFDPTNPGCGCSQMSQSFAEAMAFVDVCLVAWPPWWTGTEDVEDPMLIQLMYREAQHVDPFREIQPVPQLRFTGGQIESGGESGTASRSEHNDTGPGNIIEDLVDEEIQLADDQQSLDGKPSGGSDSGVSGGRASQK